MTTTTLAPVQASCDAHEHTDRGTPLPADQHAPGAQAHPVGGYPSSGGGHSFRDAQANPAAAGFLSPTGQVTGDAQRTAARGDSTSTETGAMVCPMPRFGSPRPGGWLRDPVLGVLADVLNDLEGVRVANANRVRILTRNEADGDGEERGHGLTEDHPEVAKLILTVKALEAAEHDATLNLQRAMRKHPLGPFVKRTVGLGEKQTARLIATLGDPYYNDLHERPRTVSELWAYAGFHVIHSSGRSHLLGDTHATTAAAGTLVHPGGQQAGDTQNPSAAGVAPKRTRGQKSNWSEDARKRTWLIASAIPKFPASPYEPVYRAARVKYADAVHSAECVRCGPSGKPALLGSPLSLGHQHARALRLVSKAILRDLWIESRNLHHEGSAA